LAEEQRTMYLLLLLSTTVQPQSNQSNFFYFKEEPFFPIVIAAFTFGLDNGNNDSPTGTTITPTTDTQLIPT